MVEMPPDLAVPARGKGARGFDHVARKQPRNVARKQPAKQAHHDILQRQKQAAAGRVYIECCSQLCVCVCVLCVILVVLLSECASCLFACLLCVQTMAVTVTAARRQL